LTPIKTSEVEISFYAKSGAGPSPIGGHALETAGNAATAAPFPYTARAVFASASVRRPRGGGTENLQIEILDLRGNRLMRANLR
jgi:hypothetical protein